MVLRYLHRGWKIFWTVILSLLLIILVVAGGALGLLQLDATKDIVVEKIENDFQKNFRGKLTIGSLEGLLPFNAELKDVVLLSPSTDSLEADTLVSIKKVNAGIDIWGLFQNKLSIDAFKLQDPSVRFLADGSGSYTLANALKKKKPQTATDEVTSSWIKNVEIVAPQVGITDGSVFIEKFYDTSDEMRLPEPFVVNQINTQLFVELTKAQRFVDIENLTAMVEDLQAGNIEISGQVYNDDQYLEFNAFHFLAGSSHLHLNGAIEGVDVYQGALRKQLSEADYDIEVSSHRLKLSEFTDVLTDIPDIEEPLDFTIQTQGQINNLALSTFRLGAGESFFSIDGQIDNLFKKNQLSYQFNIDTLALRKQDAELFLDSLNAQQFNALENLRLNGRASGSNDSLIVDVSGSSPLGSFTLNGHGQLVEPFRYRGSLTGNGLNIGPLVAGNIDTTRLNFTAVIEGQNTSLKTGTLQFVGSANNSFINHIKIDSLRLTTTLRQGAMKAEYFYRNQDQTIAGSGTANFNRNDPAITLIGNTQNVNLTALWPNSPIDTTSLNTAYEIDMQGLEQDRMQGMARFEVEESIIGGDSVRAHQLAVQLDSPDLASRTLQVKSSLFDLQMTGDIKPSNIKKQITYWSDYFSERIDQEIMLDSTYVPASRPSAVESLELQGNIEAKNLTLVRQYVPQFPSIVTNSTVDFEVLADASDLQFSSQIQSDTLVINEVQIKGAGSRLSGQFKHNRTLKEFSSLEFETDVGRLESNLFTMDSLSVMLNYEQDSLYYAQEVGRFSKDARFNLKMHSILSQKDNTVVIDDFFLGNNSYAWTNEGTPSLTYNRANEIIFNTFRFKNQTEFFALGGTLSPDRSDSLQYIIRDVNLGRISDLLTGSIDFAGRLNGTLQTRSLTQRPSIQGDLRVNRLRLQDRLVGDVSFSSNFNEEENRFDAKLKIITDSTKYAKYIAANEDIGQNIVLDGYFIPSDINTKQDTVFYFDANFNEIDMWAVQLVTQNIFTQLEGSASGSGYISGNLNDINFSADFQLDEVYARPEFLNTNYYLDGHVALNSKDGVILDDIAITDDQGGNGSISGTVDLNDFKPITFLDLQMQLNDLRFLDNSYDPDVPFYGSLAGTGSIRLSGANTDMRLRSTGGAITVSEGSTFSIPLLEETELSSTNSFIQFVDSFENPQKKQIGLSLQEVQNIDLAENTLEKAIDELTFSERFNMDLQFNAPRPINVRLIFDPVTGEVLKAEGTGRVRITLNEGDIRMFGNFAVDGGSYQFVSGEIFSRKLDIRSGGSISWEGPPDNARLDIEAVYHARPSLASLNLADNTNTDSNSGGATQRVPVDLIVEISGTLSSVENDYYFELPNDFELNTSSRAQFKLNQINRDEQQKLLQATSVLLTGNFIPTQSGNQKADLGANLSTRNTLVNPLLSNQIISPLLSNQINSLLNSDATSFDIDFNLNSENEIDLGIALRLYNDKLILRREGYIAGGGIQSDLGDRIGDLNATYRINRNLSVTAFHRQDQTLGSVRSTNQNIDFTPSVDGVGLEARVQFNTWEQLSHKVQNFFRKLVGKEKINFEEQEKEESKQQENITEQKN